MKYTIEKGDKFICLEDYVMDDDTVAYTEGKIYTSELDNHLTDDDNFVAHNMSGQDDFFKYFKFITE